jgi:uncharacterized protein YacL
MRLGPFFRVIGALLYGFIGWELGIALAGTMELTTQTWQIIVPSTVAGLLFGLIFAPWIITAPAQALGDSLRSIPISDLVAGSIGLAFGLLLAALLAFPISQLPPPFGNILPLVLVILMGYLGAAIVVLRKEDIWALFRGDAAPRTGAAPANSTSAGAVAMPHIAEAELLLDTSVIIDGRIADIARTGFLLGRLVVPHFVLNELQYIADSSEAMRRNRGRRGLEVLDKLQSTPGVSVVVIDDNPANVSQVDDKLVTLAKERAALVVTNDFNLNRVAKLQGVRVLNINELANAVKSVLLPGEAIPLKIIQEGKEIGQGVGYLEDGTMVVVENGRRYLNQEVLVQVTKVLQTNAGRLIFATPE